MSVSDDDLTAEGLDRILEAGGNEEIRLRWVGEGEQYFGGVFSPDGTFIATARPANDGTELWDAKTGKLLHRFAGTMDISGVEFSPDGKYLLSTDFEGVAWLWDTETKELVRQFTGRNDTIASGSFSPGGKYVATASYDGTAQLWDVETGQALRRLTGHSAGVENVIFSPDGKMVLTPGDDGAARLWSMDYHTTLAYICTHLRDFTDEERGQYGMTDHEPTCPGK
jgi:WD40 repeat protein